MDELRERASKLEFSRQTSRDSSSSGGPADTPTGLSGRWREAADKSRTMEDPWEEFHIEECEEERAKRHRFNAVHRKWTVDDILIKMEKEPFAHGAMRNCFRMKKLSNFAHQDWQQASNYVAKSYIKRQPKDTYFDDVELQMDAKLWGHEFNKKNPPKKVDILQTYIIEMVDRKDMPVLCVEHLIEGNYIKYNSNSGFVSDNHRRTPQAFSHFTFEHSAHKLIVVDVQGVGDLYTDPQIHTANGTEYGEANLGLKGMALFFATHRCNPICRRLALKEFEVSAREVAARDSLATAAMDTLTKVPTRVADQAEPGMTRRKLLDRGDVQALSVVRCAQSLPAIVQRVISLKEVKALQPACPKEPNTPPPTEERLALPSEGRCQVSSRSSSREEDSWKDLQRPGYRDAFSVLGQVHMEFALYHEIGRFSPDDAPNVMDSLFHVDCAARCGHRQALKTIAQIYLQLLHDVLPGITAEDSAEHRRQGLRCARQSADGGDRDMMLLVAQRYDTGDGLLSQEQTKDDLDQQLSSRSWTSALDWYSKAVEAGETDLESLPPAGPFTNYSILARQAEMLREGGFGLKRDSGRAAELYGTAAEAAMAAMKGKMANKYYVLQEEAACEEDE